MLAGDSSAVDETVMLSRLQLTLEGSSVLSEVGGGTGAAAAAAGGGGGDAKSALLGMGLILLSQVCRG
jgi:hypothetical protein